MDIQSFRERLSASTGLCETAALDWIARTSIRAIGSNIVAMPRALPAALPVELRDELDARRLPPPPEPRDVVQSIRSGLSVPTRQATQCLHAVVQVVLQSLSSRDPNDTRAALPAVWAALFVAEVPLAAGAVSEAWGRAPRPTSGSRGAAPG